MSPDEAVDAGALALFGEKYGDEVRVLSMGSLTDKHYSIELCGGTHVEALGDIGILRIVSESAVSSGVRRIEALTGESARQWLVTRDDTVKSLAALVKTTPDELEERVGALLDERRKLERELAQAKRALAMGGGGGKGAGPQIETIGDVQFLGQVIADLDPRELRGLVDENKAKIDSGVVALAAVNDGRASFAVGVTDDLTNRYSAVDMVRAGVEALGGKGGGGRADMAQGGGPDGDKANAALDAVRGLLRM